MSSQTVERAVLEEMLASACHFGHKVSKWNPKMKRYIYTKREGIHIFDLTKTYERLTEAMSFLQDAAATGKEILFVSTKLQVTRLVMEAAKRCNAPYVTRKWIPGLLTNFETVRRRIKYFRDLKQGREAGDWDKYTKKERLVLTRTLEKLENAFGGVEQLMKLPDVVIVFDAVRDTLSLKEARRLKIPTVGICDSNADPDLLTYPIPGNDDAIKSLKFFVEKLSHAVAEGKKLVNDRATGKVEKPEAAVPSPTPSVV